MIVNFTFRLNTSHINNGIEAQVIVNLIVSANGSELSCGNETKCRYIYDDVTGSLRPMTTTRLSSSTTISPLSSTQGNLTSDVSPSSTFSRSSSSEQTSSMETTTTAAKSSKILQPSTTEYEASSTEPTSGDASTSEFTINCNSTTDFETSTPYSLPSEVTSDFSNDTSLNSLYDCCPALDFGFLPLPPDCTDQFISFCNMIANGTLDPDYDVLHHWNCFKKVVKRCKDHPRWPAKGR